ncbi:TPA: Rha family transcriptional regulator [Salmonella enterica subsp. enterica serovar Muenchen]
MAMKTQIVTTEQPAMMSSKEIAKLTGKRPADVIRDIWVMLESLYSIKKDNADLRHHKNQQVTVNDGVTAYFDNRGYVSEFLLDRRHTEILITGYDVVRRAAVIDRWFDLESGARHPAVEFDWRNNPAQLRNILIGFTEQVEQVTAERDEAIRAKSRISRKREASALGKLSAATRRCRDLEEQLGESSKHATIIKVENATGRKDEFSYVPLRRWCKDNGVEAKAVPDERYGSVKSWPAGAWLDIYGIDLKSLFGA